MYFLYLDSCEGTSSQNKGKELAGQKRKFENLK
jgi:hypothetical protein